MNKRTIIVKTQKINKTFSVPTLISNIIIVGCIMAGMTASVEPKQ